MNFPISNSRISLLQILEVLGGIFHFYSNSNRTFCEQTEEILIKRSVLWHLIWVCTVCQCPTKRVLDLYGLITNSAISRCPLLVCCLDTIFSICLFHSITFPTLSIFSSVTTTMFIISVIFYYLILSQIGSWCSKNEVFKTFQHFFLSVLYSNDGDKAWKPQTMLVRLPNREDPDQTASSEEV